MSEELLETLKPIVEPQMKKDIRIMIGRKVRFISKGTWPGRQSCIGYFMIRKQEVIYLLSFFVISV